MAKKLDIYTVDPDCPVTCPKCGTRTDFREIPDTDQQEHTCQGRDCKYHFITEFADGE